MRIGIDLDDTICRTSEKIREYIDEYAQKKNLIPLDIMNDEDLKDDFFTQYLDAIYENVEIKRNVKNVLRRLKNKGNEIYIITARSQISPTHTDLEKITNDWFLKNSIQIDKLVMNCYADDKATVCKDYQIDLMIDDDPYNYKKVTAANIPCLLFDDRGRYDLEKNYMTSWLEIEKYIERNH